MSSNKGPGAGQKVDLGKDAPTKQEGAGAVPSESLAAESYEEGGDFTSNEGIRSENVTSKSTSTKTSSAGRDTTSTSTSTSTSTGRTGNAPQSSAGTAPSYVESQYQKDTSGPHGKNLKEGGWDESKVEDGLKKALNAEPGSEDDPSRLAEQQFQQNQTAAGRDAGPRQAEVDNKTAFDALSSETPS
ncbi:hypothetical protein FDECE_4406 [Fusarium decemcellulare]|nr:hypothetical protein FDECE_4406 [Fusarium decemcellulare]